MHVHPLGYGTGSEVWPAGKAFATLVAANPALLRGRAVLELGTGTGVLGICAALSQHSSASSNGDIGLRRLCLTDYLDPVLANLYCNVEVNGLVLSSLPSPVTSTAAAAAQVPGSAEAGSQHRPPPACAGEQKNGQTFAIEGPQLRSATADDVPDPAASPAGPPVLPATGFFAGLHHHHHHPDTAATSSVRTRDDSSVDARDSTAGAPAGGFVPCQPVAVEVAKLDWSDFSAFPLHEFDTVIASDTIADPHAAALLTQLLAAFLLPSSAANKGGRRFSSAQQGGARGRLPQAFIMVQRRQASTYDSFMEHIALAHLQADTLWEGENGLVLLHVHGTG